MDVFLTSDGLLALVTLAAREIVLGVDNLVFIAIVSVNSRLTDSFDGILRA
jgi:predicted tellurium resistance membrane protein TerC